jgi:membrane fusion protein (multidrug efflux system)
MEAPATPASVASAPPPPARRRGRRAFIVLAVLSVAAIGGFLFYRWWHRGQIETDNAQIDAETVPISARIGGVVATVHVHDHERVEVGAPLLALDPAELDARVRQADAELAAARAQLASALAQVEIVKASSTGGRSSATAQLDATGATVRSTTAQIAAAEASAARARHDQDRAKIELDRATKLFGESAITATSLEQTQAAFDAAQAALEQATAQVAAMREQRRTAEARVAEARGHVVQSAPVDAQVAAASAAADLAAAKVAGAEAALDRAHLDREHAEVKAPIAGTASRVSAHPGQTLAAGQPFVVIVSDEKFVIANIKEDDVHRIAPGQRATVLVDAYDGTTLAGTVESISPATGSRFSLIPPDNATGNFVKVVQRVPVRIKLAAVPAGMDLRAGLSADVTIYVK